MKKIVLAVSALVLFVSCEQAKIGYVDNVKLMDDYQEKIDIETKFEQRTATFTKKRDSLTQVLQMERQTLQAKLQNKRQMSASDQEEVQQYQQKEQFLTGQLQTEFQTLQTAGQTEMDSVVSKVKKEIEAYGKANNFTYILGGGDGGNVLYGQDVNDLTDEVVKLLNDKYKK